MKEDSVVEYRNPGVALELWESEIQKTGALKGRLAAGGEPRRNQQKTGDSIQP